MAEQPQDGTRAFPHTPVLLERVVALLGRGIDAVAAAGHTPVVADLTLGMGGHSEAVLAANPQVRVIGIDRDQQALAVATERLARFGERFTPVNARADELPRALDELGVRSLAGALFDLGVSSLQLDEDERGFSYSRPAPLDMRMDQSRGTTAAQILNTYSEDALARIIADYGEERYARKIARIIVADRAERPWETSDQLAGMLSRVIPEPPARGRQRARSHPAKRTFQALRIEVNGELDSLAAALPAALDALAIGGVAVIESYQSLEDTAVKRILRAGTETQAPPDLPVVPAHLRPWLAEAVRGAQKASAAEVEANPRAASVRLRAVVKTAPNPREETP